MSRFAELDRMENFDECCFFLFLVGEGIVTNRH